MAYGQCTGMGDSGIAPLDGLGQYDLSFNPGISELPPGQPWYAPIDQGPSYNPGMSDTAVGQPWYQDVITGAIQAGSKIAQQVLAPTYTPGYGYPSGPYPPGSPTTAPIYQQGTIMPYLSTSMQSSYLPWLLGGGALLFLLMRKH